MKRITLITTFLIGCVCLIAQDRLTPELLWQLGRVSGLGLSADGKQVIYSVSIPDAKENKSNRKYYSVPVQGGQPVELASIKSIVPDKSISPDGKFQISVQAVKIQKVFGTDYYPEFDKSNVQIYDALNYRHWDTWEDGEYNHVFLHPLTNGNRGPGKDLMHGEPHDCPQMPFGGDEDYTWSPDSKKIIYVTKKKTGKSYAVSTNTDLYEYNIAAGATTNLTEGMMGYDTEPAFSTGGALAWLSMKRDGYESDKNNIIVRSGGIITNLTQQWDGTVAHFKWSPDGKKIYFTAAIEGTVQLFEVDFPGFTKKAPVVKQITKGVFDITSIVGQTGNTLVVSRTDMNHAAELYTVNLTNGQIAQLSHVNDAAYGKRKMSK
ncbi:MAG: S9 family peptidase, partial [Cyclobacteriaceae bacterium]|nr:S9 family peptidase [Cyclobacteriaceae bacterium]